MTKHLSDNMENYIDGFILPIPKIHINTYKQVANKVAAIWKDYGAIAYFEYIGDDLLLEGTQSFTDVMDASKDEHVIFGWVVFPSKEIRDIANKKVPLDPRMEEIVTPLTDPDRLIFDASRMIYGGFHPLVQMQE